MFKKVVVDIMFEGNVIYRSEGKTVIGVMLQIAAMLVTYHSIDIHITLISKNQNYVQTKQNAKK